MTPERAIEIIKDNILFTSGVLEEAFDVIEQALKKQIPKKPNYPNEYKIRCPICDTPVIDGQPYCDECGQALDWSDEE